MISARLVAGSEDEMSTGGFAAAAVGLAGGLLVYGALKVAVGLRLEPEEEFNGADLTAHRITATPEREPSW